MDEPDETFTVTLSVPSHARWQPQRRLWQPNVDGMRVAVAGPYGHERVTAWRDGADAQRKNTAGGFVWGLYTKVAKRVDDTAMFPDNATAERWFVEQRWHGVIACPSCGSVNVQTGCKHKSMPYRCREGIDAPICQDSRSRSQVCGLARSVVCHHALKDLAGEKAFETADDLPFGPPFSGASFDVVEGW